MQKKAKVFLLSLFLLSGFLFVGCGSGGSTTADANSTVDVNATVDLRSELKESTFYAVQDDVQSKGLYKVSFDANLTSWNIQAYDNNYATPIQESVTGDINVTADTITDAGGSLQLVSKEANYLSLVSTANPLMKLKFFATSALAEAYYNLSLSDELKAKEFFVVQNNASNRSLYKIKFTDVLTQWDVTTYSTSYADADRLSSNYGTPITVTDSNLTDSGGSVFRFQNKEVDYLTLVSANSSTLALKFYASEALALEYFNSFDLRKELRSQTFYAVSNNGTNKALFKFVFTEDLSSWNISIYTGDYLSAPTQSADAQIAVTENMLADSSSSLKVASKESDYINLVSIKESSLTFRFYASSELAQTYFKE
ncbi:MAG: hypothetical protein Q7S59_09580 [Sulfurimonas sp.]|nr:hypothetical protein [Sulfurimonas sp.]